MINRPSHSSAPDPTHPIEVAILGPLEVRQVGALVKLPGERHGALLVDLVLEPGRRVSTELLVDHLWGASPPPSATKTLQKYVSELRRALGTSVDGFLATEGHGYALRLPPDSVDAHRFESMVADARALAGAAAVEQLEAAEALWRGPALDGFAELDHVRPTAQRLEESRLGRASARARPRSPRARRGAARTRTTHSRAPATRGDVGVADGRPRARRPPRRGARRISPRSPPPRRRTRHRAVGPPAGHRTAGTVRRDRRGTDVANRAADSARNIWDSVARSS